MTINNRRNHKTSMSNRAFEQLKPKGITKDGQAWLTTALDPFHDDLSVRPVGLPDKNYNPSIVKVHNRQITLKAPADLPENTNWSCHIFTSPIQNNATFTKSLGYSTGRITSSNIDQDITLGTVTAVTYPDGEGWFQPGTDNEFVDGYEAFAISSNTESNSTLDNTLTRLVGGGFEVSNDTASLYAQGHVLCYSTTNPPTNDITAGWNYAPNISKSPVVRFRRQPDTIEKARAIQNSVGWKATEGVYIPFRINLDNNEYQIRRHTPYVFSGSSTWNYADNEQILVSKVYADSFDADQFPQMQDPILPAGIHNSGCFFTGLSPQTTLTLSVRFIEEVAPIDNVDLLSFGSQLNLYDPVALESYQRLMQLIPVAVTYDENSSAEFWGKILGAASKVLPVVGTALGAPMVGKGLGALADMGSRKIAEKAAKQKIELKNKEKQIRDMKNKLVVSSKKKK